jgi:hypothetical protein
VPRRSPAATAAALSSFLFDARACAAAGAAGQAAVERDHDPHTFMKSYDELLRTIVGERR